MEVSEFPERRPYTHLRDVIDLASARPLSDRAINGFRRRLEQGNLGRHPGFRDEVATFAAAGRLDLAGVG
jgi:DNA (cytosine-5)-methyltransferase 1